jgi:2-keto-4-pentenoate hydratase/2-oxohepta-3-ene-1,7-dioic acid hydratase in catechol pathway
VKLVTYELGASRSRAGALIDDGTIIVDLAAASEARFSSVDPDFHSVQAMLEGGEEALEKARSLLRTAPASARVPFAKATLHAPIQPPIQMRDCLCFEGHLINAFKNMRQMRASLSPDSGGKTSELERDGAITIPKIFYERPIYYKANRFSVIGTDRDVMWPPYSECFDFELEFGCYIGKRAVDVEKEQARPYIYGYTIFNDFTARDTQGIEMAGQLGPAKSKDFDTANPMGPCLVTADELDDPYNLTMIARVNGEEWARGNSGTMFWRFEDLIAHISRSETLFPGEFLGSGTVEGGCGLEHMRFLSDGDIVELEVANIGILRNRVVRRG